MRMHNVYRNANRNLRHIHYIYQSYPKSYTKLLELSYSHRKCVKSSVPYSFATKSPYVCIFMHVWFMYMRYAYVGIYGTCMRMCMRLFISWRLSIDLSYPENRSETTYAKLF